MPTFIKYLAVILGSVFCLSHGVIAQEEAHHQPPVGVKQRFLTKTDLTGLSDRQGIMGLMELAPGTATGKHFHHGDELGYVIEGQIDLEIDGRDLQRLGTGEAFKIMSGEIYKVSSFGAVPAKVIVSLVVEKNKPMSELAK